MCSACSDSDSDSEEGLIGEWEGTTEWVNSEGKPIDASISCIIKSTTGNNRSVQLTVVSTSFEFIAVEDLNELIYTNSPIQNDSTGRTLISGSAVLLNDTLLHFDHKVNTFNNGGALNNSEEGIFDMVRK